MTRPLEGCRVVVTRARPGELASKLSERGAVVVHVPLIEVVDADDGGRALRDALNDLAAFDWVMVTSAEGAERVGAAVRHTPGVRLAAVGTTTARVLAQLGGRVVDVVPAVQRAEELAAAFVAECSSPQRVLIAQAERAEPGLAAALRDAGHDVTTVTAYRTIAAVPDADTVRAASDADAVVFASGSAVESWCAAFGTHSPPIVVAIGPTTAAAAQRMGLVLSGVAGDHSLDGLVSELERLVHQQST